MCGNSMRENREALQTPTLDASGTVEKVKAVMSTCTFVGSRTAS